MDTFNEQKKVGDQYKLHFFDFFAKFFCILSEKVITRFGEQGKETIIEAIKKYGERRGKDIAKIVKSLGKELTLKNYYVYNTFDTRQTAKYKLNIVEGNIEAIIRDCVFCNGCKDWDMLEYGKIYCDYIDEAVLKGYNPDLNIEVPTTLTKGDKRCIQRYIVKK
ncbi:MAG: L-2-amino-thiazoline-4-carboxylic acid hydrolase [Promethearchaeota archaeon]